MRNFYIALILALFVLVWTFLPFWSHPERMFGPAFISHDLAYQLHLNDELMAGKKLYLQVFSQYGPASAFLNLLAAYFFGSSARTFMLLQALLAIICLFQAYVLLRRSMSIWWAVSFTAIALLPWMPSPAGGPGAYLGPYGGFERILLLGIALTWRPMTERSSSRNLGLGLLLGLLPWVKFGSAFVAGAALVITDVIDLMRRREFYRAGWKKVSFSNLQILLGFLAGQCALVIYLVMTQPRNIARDVLWPIYMVGNYAGYVNADTRFPHWHNFGYFVGVQLPVLVAAVCFALLCLRMIGRVPRAIQNGPPQTRSLPLAPFLFLFLFWFLGMFGYLAHVWLIMGYVWLPIIGAAGALAGLRWIVRFAALCACFPCFLLTLKGITPARLQTDVEPVTLENGETLWLDSIWRARIQSLSKLLVEQCGPSNQSETKAVIGFPTGGGIAHYFGYSVLTRHSWFVSGFIRPYDEEAILASLSRTGAAVVFLNAPIDEKSSSNPNSWGFGPIFSEKLAAEISNRFQAPIKIDQTCWVFPIRPVDSRQ